jgi:hypothetical protein
VTTEKGTGKGKAASASADVTERVPFLLLGLDLPPAPLFKDALEKNIIPQVGGQQGRWLSCLGCDRVAIAGCLRVYGRGGYTLAVHAVHRQQLSAGYL